MQKRQLLRLFSNLFKPFLWELASSFLATNKATHQKILLILP